MTPGSWILSILQISLSSKQGEQQDEAAGSSSTSRGRIERHKAATTGSFNEADTFKQIPEEVSSNFSISSECNRLVAYRSYLHLLIQHARSESEMSSLIDEQPARTKKNGKANGSGRTRKSEVRSCRPSVIIILRELEPNHIPSLEQGEDSKPKVSLCALCIPVASPVWTSDTCIVPCSNATETTSDK
jgi:hypothetical protein